MRVVSLFSVLLVGLAACSSGDDDTGAPDAGALDATTAREDAGARTDANVANADASTTDGGGTEDAGAEPDAGPGCLEVQGDLSMDFDLRATFAATVEVTFNGAPPPPTTNGDRGLVSFISGVTQGSTFDRIEGMTGPIVAETDVVAGPYDLRYSGGGCSSPDATPYCASGVVTAPLGAGNNVVDFPFGTFDLTLTLDGNTFPEAPKGTSDRGRLWFPSGTERVFLSRLFTVPAMGDARVATGAFPGTYDIQYDTRGLCPDVVCGGGSIGTLTLGSTPDVQTIDLRTVTVSGVITQNGAAVPSTGNGPGVLSFYDFERTRSLGDVPVDDTGAYTVRLIAGRYAVWYGGFDLGEAGTTPVDQRFIQLDAPFTADTTANFDLVTARADLGLTVDGAPVSNGDGTLILVHEGEGAAFIPLSDLSANARWRRVLNRGTYTARFDPPNPCDPSGPLPCIRHDFQTLDVSADTTTTLDITTHAVSITLTAAGADLLDSTRERGRVNVQLIDGPPGSSVDLVVPAAGPATVTAQLPPGRYRVYYTTLPDDRCISGGLGPIPCGGQTLGELDVSADTATSIDIPSVVVSGTIRIAGNAVMVPNGVRAAMTFENPSVASYDAAIDSSGRYSVRLPAADYRVIFYPYELCVGRDVPDPRPCAPQVLRRCDSAQ